MISTSNCDEGGHLLIDLPSLELQVRANKTPLASELEGSRLRVSSKAYDDRSSVKHLGSRTYEAVRELAYRSSIG